MHPFGNLNISQACCHFSATPNLCDTHFLQSTPALYPRELWVFTTLKPMLTLLGGLLHSKHRPLHDLGHLCNLLMSSMGDSFNRGSVSHTLS